VAYSTITTGTFEKLNVIAAQKIHLAAAYHGIRALLTAATVFGLLGVVFCGLQRRLTQTVPQPVTAAISWRKLGLILGPFIAAYIALLALQPALFDRYFLPLLAILILALARFYQERVQAKLPSACVPLIVLFGVFGVAATHDKFALFRGYANAIDELRSRGTPATAILGPWEFGGWIQVERAGHVNDSRMLVPKGDHVPQAARFLPANCTPGLFGALAAMPDVHPVYAVSPNPRDCGGQAAYPLATYRTWIAPHVNTIYAVRLPESFPN